MRKKSIHLTFLSVKGIWLFTTKTLRSTCSYEVTYTQEKTLHTQKKIRDWNGKGIFIFHMLVTFSPQYEELIPKAGNKNQNKMGKGKRGN